MRLAKKYLPYTEKSTADLILSAQGTNGGRPAFRPNDPDRDHQSPQRATRTKTFKRERNSVEHRKHRLEREDLDIVCGWRKDRKDAWINRRLPSVLANALISWATGVKLNDYGCSLKVFRAEVVKPLRLYGEMHRFLPALASEMGVRIAEQPVNHRARVHGRSKYGISRTVRVVLDLITVKFLLSYSTRPLQMFGLMGGIMGGTGATILGYLGFMRLTQVYYPLNDRIPLVMFAILLGFTGVQLVTVGLLAEMQARTYHESQGKPVYVVRRVLESSDR